MDGAYEHLPDSDDHFENKNLYEDVKLKIAEYEQYKDSLSRGALEISLDDFFEDIYAPKVDAKIVAAPTS